MVQIPIASGDFPGLIFEDWMLIVKKHIIAAAVLCTLASGAALAQQAQKTEGPWMVRARAVYVDTYNSTSGVATALDLNVDSKWIPEVDISYFFNKNVAAELILTWPQKMTVNAGNTSIGSIKVLPPTLLLQYHFDGLCHHQQQQLGWRLAGWRGHSAQGQHVPQPGSEEGLDGDRRLCRRCQLG